MSKGDLKTITVFISRKALEPLAQEVMLRKQREDISEELDWFAKAVIGAMIMGKEEVTFWEVPGE